MNNEKYIVELIDRYPELIDIKEKIYKAYLIMCDAYKRGNKLLIAGNGGSASDADHIVGELMKSFECKHPISQNLASELARIGSNDGIMLANNLEIPLPAIALTNHIGLSTAYINDVDGKCVFAQQLFGYGKAGDVFLAITTSGNSKNVVLAAILAKTLGIKVIALTGNRHGEIEKYADLVIDVPESETFKIQELHLPIYHCICRMLENYFFGNTQR